MKRFLCAWVLPALTYFGALGIADEYLELTSRERSCLAGGVLLGAAILLLILSLEAMFDAREQPETEPEEVE